MSEPISLTVYTDPVGKARPRVLRSGRTYTPKGTVVAENTIAATWRAHYGARKPWARGIPLSVEILAYLARPKSSKRTLPSVKPDSSNLLKLCEDALNGLAWEDDAQIVEAKITKLYDTVPRWVIWIREYGEVMGK